MLRSAVGTLLPSPTPNMNVLALTILVSSCLAGIFIACFAMELRRARRSSPERDSLLPLDLETLPVVKTRAETSLPHHLP
jgi:hypothetical protein